MLQFLPYNGGFQRNRRVNKREEVDGKKLCCVLYYNVKKAGYEGATHRSISTIHNILSLVPHLISTLENYFDFSHNTQYVCCKNIYTTSGWWCFFPSLTQDTTVSTAALFGASVPTRKIAMALFIPLFVNTFVYLKSCLVEMNECPIGRFFHQFRQPNRASHCSN